ncbi:MAG: DUF2029 domain-containing protein [Rhodospirillales bacterium]|nr:DUF2029 domain-containing protein [Rhodospirillales bacterium]
MMPQRATTNFAGRMITIMVAASLALNITALAALLAAHARLNSDFMAFWSFPRFVAAHPAGQLYNAAALTAFQQQLYPGFHSFYPYLYPPTLLLALSWLKFIGFFPAELLWTLLGCLALAISVRAMFPGRPWATLAGLLACPAALICATTGETAFFTTALLLAGFAWLPQRPVLAGVCFGLLTLKPQLGVLLPFFLLARGDWRAIYSACATALLLNGLSCVVLPANLWALWWHTLPAYQSSYFNAVKVLNLNIIVTPAANLVVLGVSQRVAWIVQAICGISMVLLTIWAARRAPYRLAVAVTLIATFLAQPHAYAYDSIAAIAALALAMEALPGPRASALGIAAYLAPWVLLSPAAHWFLYAPLLAACLATIVALAFSAQKSAKFGHEPNRLLPPTAT